MVERLRSELPDPPAARIARLGAELDLERALVLVTGGLDRLYEETVAAGAERIAAANVIANNLVGAGVDPEAVRPEELAALVGARDRIPRQVFDEAISKPASRASPPRPISRRRRFPRRRELDPVIDAILAANPGQVGGLPGRQGRPSRLLRRPGDEETGGTANPRVVSELVRAKLGA